MKPVSQEEYKAMQAKDWEWAKALIQCQIDDKRPGVQHLTNRPIINIKQMLESSAELYGDGIAFHTMGDKGGTHSVYVIKHFSVGNCSVGSLFKFGIKCNAVTIKLCA